jgi:phenylalanyl-tRNA synthetase beta chain
MDIKILHSWLSEFLKTTAKPQEIGEYLALSGPSVETVEKYNKDDWLYSIEVTTNRVDMMSVLGIAREAATILPRFNKKAEFIPLKLNKDEIILPSKSQSLPLSIEMDKELSYRVMAIVMDNIQVSPSPKWLQQRLEAAEIRSLNNVIDITNYVMTEVGHPCHVFDYDKIQTNRLVFRKSKPGEKIITLDDKTHTLTGNDIVIEDGTGKIIDLPGIMGTKNSVVSSDTKRIIFFIDNNDPVLIRKTSMRLGIRTVAATLNEKRVDPELAQTAMFRGIQLCKELASAKAASKIHDIYPIKPKKSVIITSLDFINERLGVEVDSNFVSQTLKNLGFTVSQSNSKNPVFTVTIPSWRTHDISIPEDIVEEVARIYGYHQLPSIIPSGDLPLPNPQEKQFCWEDRIKKALKYWGFIENYTYSLVSKDLIEKANLKPQNHLKLKNPLTTDWEYLRTSLIPSLLVSINQNQDREENLKIFEMANIYLPKDNDLPNEQLNLAIMQTGNDFIKIKEVIETIAKDLNIPPKFIQSNIILDYEVIKSSKFFQEKYAANIFHQGTKLGSIGLIKQELLSKFAIKKPVLAAYLNVDETTKLANKNKKFIPIPKYPPVIEDMTFFNNENVSSVKISQTAIQAGRPITTNISFSSYENKITLRITYQDKNRNLSAEDIKPFRRNIVEKLQNIGLELQGEI